MHERWNRESEICYYLESAVGTNRNVTQILGVDYRNSSSDIPPVDSSRPGVTNKPYIQSRDLSLALQRPRFRVVYTPIPTTYSGTEAGPLSCRNRNRSPRVFCSRVYARIRLPPPRLNIGSRRHRLTKDFNLSVRRDGTSSMYGT